MKSSAKLLRALTHKKNIFFVDRGNSAILLVLQLAKSLDKKKLLLQDQGGWLTYDQYAKKLKFEYHFLDTDYGILDVKQVKENSSPDTVFLINSMPGYFAHQKHMDKITTCCNQNDTLFINDASGSIGTKDATYGDIIIGSFGRWKPINLEYGGFIAFDDAQYHTFFKEHFKKELKDFDVDLCKKLESLDQRRAYLLSVATKIKKQLKDFSVLHRNNEGFNVIVKFLSDEERMKIIEFCKLYGYAFTLCPRYIRVLETAISIEVKRL